MERVEVSQMFRGEGGISAFTLMGEENLQGVQVLHAGSGHNLQCALQKAFQQDDLLFLSACSRAMEKQLREVLKKPESAT